MKQSAVEFLIKNLEFFNLIKDGDLENELFRQIELDSKEMEKQQQDEFVIKFTDWCEDYYYDKGIWYDNPDFDNAKEFSTKELLEIFKNK